MGNGRVTRGGNETLVALTPLVEGEITKLVHPDGKGLVRVVIVLANVVHVHLEVLEAGILLLRRGIRAGELLTELIPEGLVGIIRQWIEGRRREDDEKRKSHGNSRVENES